MGSIALRHTYTERIQSFILSSTSKNPIQQVETGSHNLIRELLQDNQRLALLSLQQIHRELEMGLFTTLPYDLSFSHRDIGLSMRRDWQPTNRQQEVLTLIRQING